MPAGTLPKSGEITMVSEPGTGQQGDLQRPLTSTEQKQVVDQIMQARAREQAAGLGGGSVTVNGAWNYTGYSYLSPNPEAAIKARLVAVDLTATGHTPAFDFDDIEIIDGDNNISYGSDPHATPLNLESGKALPETTLIPAGPRASRWLMIYAFPEETKHFHLYYWGQQLTQKTVTVAPSGWELPWPKEAAE